MRAEFHAKNKCGGRKHKRWLHRYIFQANSHFNKPTKTIATQLKSQAFSKLSSAAWRTPTNGSSVTNHQLLNTPRGAAASWSQSNGSSDTGYYFHGTLRYLSSRSVARRFYPATFYHLQTLSEPLHPTPFLTLTRSKQRGGRALVVEKALFVVKMITAVATTNRRPDKDTT